MFARLVIVNASCVLFRNYLNNNKCLTRGFSIKFWAVTPLMSPWEIIIENSLLKEKWKTTTLCDVKCGRQQFYIGNDLVKYQYANQFNKIGDKLTGPITPACSESDNYFLQDNGSFGPRMDIFTFVLNRTVGVNDPKYPGKINGRYFFIINSKGECLGYEESFEPCKYGSSEIEEQLWSAENFIVEAETFYKGCTYPY